MGSLCAPFEVSLWGWLHLACVPKAQLFPGLVTALLFVGGFLLLAQASGARSADRRLDRGAPRAGASPSPSCSWRSSLAWSPSAPWRVEWGPVSAHARIGRRPFMIAAVAAGVCLRPSPGVRAAVTQASAARLLSWPPGVHVVVALGPDPQGRGRSVGSARALSAARCRLPGFNGLRVPARFWLMATLCLSWWWRSPCSAPAAGAPHGGAGRAGRAPSRWACSSDGWEHMPRCARRQGRPIPSRASRPDRCCTCRLEPITDVFPTYYAVSRDWRAVNGYSGFEPNHYDGVRQASKLAARRPVPDYRSAPTCTWWSPPMRRACARWSSVSRARNARRRAPPRPSTVCRVAADAPRCAAWDSREGRQRVLVLPAGAGADRRALRRDLDVRTADGQRVDHARRCISRAR